MKIIYINLSEQYELRAYGGRGCRTIGETDLALVFQSCLDQGLSHVLPPYAQGKYKSHMQPPPQAYKPRFIGNSVSFSSSQEINHNIQCIIINEIIIRVTLISF